MFWDSLVARLVTAQESCVLMVGAGEREARYGFVSGATEVNLRETETGGAIKIPDDNARLAYELSMRSRGKKIVQKISDEGISSTMVLGSDRKQLFVSKDGHLQADRLASLLDFTASGVVTIIMTSGRDDALNVVDIDPLRAGLALYQVSERNSSIPNVDIVLLVRKTSTAGLLIDSGKSNVPGEIVEPPCIPASVFRAEPALSEIQIYVTTPSRLFTGRAAVLAL